MSLNEWLAIGLLIGFFLMLMGGMPVGITLAASGFIFGFMGFGESLFNLLPARIYGVVANYQWLAIPLFVFMGVMLEKSRLAEDLLDVIGHLAGGLRGGMALGIIGVGVLMGATTGIVGATVITLGLLTLPTLLRRGYDPAISCGAICASGTLGQIIPPSLVLILLSDIMQLSVGTLFAAAVLPGLMLAGLYVQLDRGLRHDPARLDAAGAAGRARRACRARSCGCACVKVALPPVALVLSVLGSIIGGIAAPTEAASMGALGSILVVALARRLSLAVLRDVMQTTTRISAMVLFILICSQVFSLAFRGLQGEKLIEDLFAFLPGGINTAIWFLMAPDLRARLFHRVDRDQLHRRAAVPADLRGGRRRHGLAGDDDHRQPADLVPDAAFRLGAVFPARRGAAGGDHAPHLPRRDSVRGAADPGHRAGVLLPGDRDLAAQGDRLVGPGDTAPNRLPWRMKAAQPMAPAALARTLQVSLELVRLASVRTEVVALSAR